MYHRENETTTGTHDIEITTSDTSVQNDGGFVSLNL